MTHYSNRYEQNVRQARRFAALELLGVLGSVIGLILIPVALRCCPKLLAVVLPVFLISTVVFVYTVMRSRSQEEYCHRLALVRDISMDTVPGCFHAQAFGEGCYFSVFTKGRYRVRLIVQNAADAAPKALDKRRKAVNRFLNKQIPGSEWGTTDEVSHRVRIYMIVCPTQREELTRWFLKNGGELLRRNEGIFPIMLVTDEKAAYFPACPLGSLPFEIKRYRFCVNFLTGKLVR